MSSAQVRKNSFLFGTIVIDTSQSQVYLFLLQWHARKIRDQENLKCTVRQCQINSPFQLSIEDIKLRLTKCKEKCNHFRKHGKCHRNNFHPLPLKQLRDRRMRLLNVKSLRS